MYMEYRKLLFGLIFILYCFFTVQGQFEIKTNVLGLANNNYNGQVELLLSDKSGIDMEISYRNTPWLAALAGSEIKNNAFRGLLAYKYYLRAEDPTSGLFFGPYFRLRIANLENIPTSLPETYTGSEENPGIAKVINNSFSIGLQAGQKITFNNNFIIEYYAGLGYNALNQLKFRNNFSNDLKDNLIIETNSFTWPWDFRLGLSIGYRFWR